jgi:hypothetical protein
MMRSEPMFAIEKEHGTDKKIKGMNHGASPGPGSRSKREIYTKKLNCQ